MLKWTVIEDDDYTVLKSEDETWYYKIHNYGHKAELFTSMSEDNPHTHGKTFSSVDDAVDYANKFSSNNRSNVL